MVLTVGAACGQTHFGSGQWESLLVDRVEGSGFDVLTSVDAIEPPQRDLVGVEDVENHVLRVTHEGSTVLQAYTNSNDYISACWATAEHVYCMRVVVEQLDDRIVGERYTIERIDALGHLITCTDVSSYQDSDATLHFQRIDRHGEFVFMLSKNGQVFEEVIEVPCD